MCVWGPELTRCVHISCSERQNEELKLEFDLNSRPNSHQMTETRDFQWDVSFVFSVPLALVAWQVLAVGRLVRTRGSVKSIYGGVNSPESQSNVRF